MEGEALTGNSIYFELRDFRCILQGCSVQSCKMLLRAWKVLRTYADVRSSRSYVRAMSRYVLPISLCPSNLFVCPLSVVLCPSNSTRCPCNPFMSSESLHMSDPYHVMSPQSPDVLLKL